MKIKNILLLAIAAALAVACHDNPEPVKLMVTVSIEPLRYFVEQIARDRIDVVTMVPSGNNPETYEPTARQMVALTNSDLYIKVGNLGFEQTWMKRLKNNAPHLIIADASQGIRPLPTTGATGDPHTWMSPANALRMAYNIYSSLARLDAKDSMFFKSNLDSLRDVIIKTDAVISEKLRSLDKRSFIIYHPALSYYAYDYGLKQLAIEEDGREPSAASLQNLIDNAKRQGAKLMFMQKEFANRNSDIVSRGTGARVVVINPLSYDWDKEILKITDELCKQ